MCVHIFTYVCAYMHMYYVCIQSVLGIEPDPYSCKTIILLLS